MKAAVEMATFLSQLKSFGVTVESGYDVVQDTGQKIEFGEFRKVVVRRPDHMRVDVERRDGSSGGFVFDGKEIKVFNVQDNVYASAPRPGNLDQAIDYFVQDLEMRLPLAELASSDLPGLLQQDITSARYIGTEKFDGVLCDHLALRNSEADLQIWVRKGNTPLPQRLIITYKRAEGQPQYWAQFSDWNLSPEAPDTLFAYTPPENAERIPFLTRSRGQIPGEGK